MIEIAVTLVEITLAFSTRDTEAGLAAAEDLRMEHRMVASAFRIFFQRSAISL
jgi:hypothetical protein